MLLKTSAWAAGAPALLSCWLPLSWPRMRSALPLAGGAAPLPGFLLTAAIPTATMQSVIAFCMPCESWCASSRFLAHLRALKTVVDPVIPLSQIHATKWYA